jgi:pimeloyl-ACP methyl ester carboxylesterase
LAGPDDALPPLRVVALHGAGSGPWVFADWRLPGHELEAVDLHAGLNVAAASMWNYEAVATRACDGIERPFALLGWSMGGLVAMLAARRVEPDALVLLEPSPTERRAAEDADLEEGVYDPEEAYGPFPAGIRARPESRYARAERLRGIPVAPPTARTLVVSGDEFAEERGSADGAEELHLAGLDHWGLILDARVQDEIAAWLAS